ncbi:MAG TPA: radical SAM protein [Candidatus Deferrimicrobium sp.]|nr:radical SAM protein [Candidatus Deferrimicrobium sp.]
MANKIVLINTPTKHKRFSSIIPLGLVNLGTILKVSDYDVELIDINAEKPYDLNLNPQPLKPHEFIQRIKKLDPDIVGITSYTENYPIAMKIANLCKNYNERIKIIFGGVHATFQALECMNENPAIDIVLRGESEHLIIDVIKAFSGKLEFNKINNIVYRENSLIKFAHTFTLPDLNTVPPPDLDLIKNKHYPPFSLPLESSRGCPFQCIFCCVSPSSNREVRFFPPQRVATTLNSYQERFGKYSFSITDSNFLLNPKRVYLLFKEIKDRKIILDNWLFQSNVTTINRELLTYLKCFNASRIFLGIEEIHDGILKTIEKNQTFEQIENSIKVLHELDYVIHANFIIGLPSQTKELMLETLEFSKTVDYATFPCLVPFPGTKIFTSPDQFGLTILSKDWQLYTLMEIVLDSVSFPVVQQKQLQDLAWRLLAERELEIDAPLYFRTKYYERLLDVGFERWNNEWKKEHESGWN